MKFLALLAICLVFASAQEEVEDPDVLVLTTENFEQTVAENEFLLVEFYAPWCGHCKRLAPEYAKAATTLKGSVALGKVDATIERDLGTQFGVRGYPTLKFFRGGAPTDYTGERSADGIVSWCKKKSGPLSVPVESADDLATVTDGATALVGFFADRESEEYAEFLALAKDDAKFGDFAFADSTNSELGSGYTLYTTHTEPQTYDASSGLKLGEWVLSYGYPLVPEVDGKSFGRLISTGHPLGIFFVDNDEDNTAARTAINEAAEELRGKLNIGHGDGVRFVQQIKRMGGDGETLPWLGVLSNDQKYNYPYDGEFTKEAVVAWANKVLDGSVEPHVRSQPIPETNDGPVTTVVQKSLKDIVYDTTKDVLLEIYAPWCGHCKQLAPIYEQLGEAFSDVESVVIAQIDGSANDMPDLEFGGFPTLKFFAANDKTGVDYDGARTYEALKSYVESKASIEIVHSGKAEAVDEPTDTPPKEEL